MREEEWKQQIHRNRKENGKRNAGKQTFGEMNKEYSDEKVWEKCLLIIGKK